MTNKPGFLDLRSQSSSSVSTTHSRPLRSPRLHVAGDVPPSMSPLDAFAAQSRALAKQLQESETRTGRRMSRLPPLTVESPLIVQGRSEYFRSLSHDSASDQENVSPLQPQPSTGLGLTTEVEDPLERPVSVHPRMSRIPPTPDEPVPLPSNSLLEQAREQARGRQLERLEENQGLYGARREQSPGDLESLTEHVTELRPTGPDTNPREAPTLSNPFSSSPGKLSKTISNESTALFPPRSMFPKRSSSIMSAPPETNDDTLSASTPSQAPRKLSSSSATAAGATPVVPSPISHYRRSPSICSDVSAPLPRPSFNFSRPLSRSGTPTMEMPSRQASSDSQPSFVLADDTAHTPISMHSDAFTESEDGKGAPSYIYAKYSLPRGKALQRESIIFQGNDPNSAFSFEPPAGPSHPRSGQAPPSPPTRPSSSSSSRYHDGSNGDSLLARPSVERSKLSAETSANGRQLSPGSSRPSTGSRQSEDAPRGRSPRGRSLTTSAHEQPRGRPPLSPLSAATSDSASTIRPPKSSHSHAPTAAEMSAEEHLSKGIKCHEEGSVKESTYHLRLAARGGDPTGMLLYALACRHGWGMRPNQREGVEWLRKAADIVSAEIADDEDQIKEGKSVDFMDRKTRKAQFALSIYELGVSHMNGWGIEQDKALALRCFEIAGSWGDVDALAEAGFCYAQGVGCKKDLKKSAKFYRMAEAKGMSMPGNSWIHKAKYSDDTESTKSKVRSKSRSRGIFSKKH